MLCNIGCQETPTGDVRAAAKPSWTGATSGGSEYKMLGEASVVTRWVIQERQQVACSRGRTPGRRPGNKKMGPRKHGDNGGVARGKGGVL